MRAPLTHFFGYFFNYFITNKCEIVLGRFFCRFVVDENPKNKRGVVYDAIGWLRVRQGLETKKKTVPFSIF